MVARGETRDTPRTFQPSAFWMLALLACAVFVVVAILLLRDDGSTSKAEVTAAPPAVVEPIEGRHVSRVQLSAPAAQRIGLRTTAVRAARSAAGGAALIVPYSAVIYDDTGHTWVYTSPAKLSFVRAPVVIERIVGQLAVLARGPAAGTSVVTVGATELFGSEFEVGH
jgi:hypothetical protein